MHAWLPMRVCVCVWRVHFTVCLQQITCVLINQHAATPSKPPSTMKKAPSSQLKQLLERYNLTIEVISKEVSDDHIKEIYSQMENWEQVANHLGLTGPDIQAIEGRAGKDVVKMRMYTLQDWKSKPENRISGTVT